MDLSVRLFGRVSAVVLMFATVAFGSLSVSAHGDHDHPGDGITADGGSSEPEQSDDNVDAGGVDGSGVDVAGGLGGEVAGPEFSAVEPERVLDTRQSGRVTAGSVVEVGLPSDIRSISDVSAAVLTVTVVNPSGWGFVTVFPCGASLPDASNVNYTAGLTRAATVFSKLGDGNKICVFTHADTDLLVDVTGVFYDTSAFTALTPFRLADSRKTETVTGGTSLTVPVHGRGGVTTDATHAVVTLTTVEASGWGFLTAYACGGSVPDASNVNYDAGWTVANQAIVPLSTTGELCVYTYADTDILVDVVGYFTGIDAIDAPTRIADTRPGNSERYTSRSLRPNTWNNTNDPANASMHRIIMVDASQIGDNVSSIYANITVIPNTGTDGFVAPIPCGATGDSDAGSSVVNYAGGVIANSAVLDVNRAGYTCIMVRDYKQSAADIDIAVDVIGWTPAGWDTDGDGIEDTDETPGCETTSDCDNDGTPDRFEQIHCSVDRTCETFNDSEGELDLTDLPPPHESLEGYLDEVVPTVLFDSSSRGQVLAGQVLPLRIAGRAGVPQNADAVRLVIKVSNPETWTFIYGFMCGAEGWPPYEGFDPIGSSAPVGVHVLGSVYPYPGVEPSPIAAALPLSFTGEVCLATSADAAMKVTVTGSFSNLDMVGNALHNTNQEWSGDYSYDYASSALVNANSDVSVINVDQSYDSRWIAGLAGLVGYLPSTVDLDHDGAEDRDEPESCVGVTDCDGDGIRDALETPDCIQDPSCLAEGVNRPNWATDTDGDGVVDIDEWGTWMDSSCETLVDCDRDGLPDGEEIKWCTVNVDCDGDGVNDVDEIRGCELDMDCDRDGLTDDVDPHPLNHDADSDGRLDGAVFSEWCDAQKDSNCDWSVDDGDVITAGYDHQPSIPATGIGENIYMHDLAAEYSGQIVLDYELFWCDNTTFASQTDGWTPNFDQHHNTLSQPMALNALEILFPRISQQLTDGKVTVNVLPGQSQIAHPSTGDCEWDEATPGANWVLWQPYGNQSESLTWAWGGTIQDLIEGRKGISMVNESLIAPNNLSDQGWDPQAVDWVLAHEYGHNLGWGHAYSWVHSDRNPEYNSDFDVMGDGTTLGVFTTVDRLASIGAVSPEQIVTHGTGTTTATLSAHTAFRGSHPSADSQRAILAVAPMLERTRKGLDVGVLMEPVRFGVHKGVMLNYAQLYRAGDVRTIGDLNWFESEPLTKHEWESSFVPVGMPINILGLTIEVLSQDDLGNTDIRVTGSLEPGHGFFDGENTFAIAK